MTLQRFYYETDTEEHTVEAFDKDGNPLPMPSAEVQGYSVFDRQHGHQNTMAFCLRRDDAEAIVEALNLHFRLQEAGL